jgi:hypothetical protein
MAQRFTNSHPYLELKKARRETELAQSAKNDAVSEAQRREDRRVAESLSGKDAAPPDNISSSDKEAGVQQARAEYTELLRPFNRPAPTPSPEEHPDQYRRRVLPIVQSVAPGFGDLKVDDYLRGPNLNYIEKQIQDAARKKALHPTQIPDGELREVTRYDKSGRPFYEFCGRPSSWMNQFTLEAKRRLVGIKTNIHETPNYSGVGVRTFG